MSPEMHENIYLGGIGLAQFKKGLTGNNQKSQRTYNGKHNINRDERVKMKFFNVSNVISFDRITSFIKFDIYCIVPEPSRIDFPCIFQWTTFKHQLVVFMAYAV